MGVILRTITGICLLVVIVFKVDHKDLLDLVATGVAILLLYGGGKD